MQSQFVFPLTAAGAASLSPEDLLALTGSAQMQADAFLMFVQAERVEMDQYAIADVDGAIGVYRGAPERGELIGRVTAWCRPH